MAAGDQGDGSGDTTIIIIPERPPEPLANPRIEFAAETHIGKVRSNNEDQYLIIRLRKALDILATSLAPEDQVHPVEREGHVLLVADGMGGHAAGERASTTVVNEAVQHVMETAKWFFRLDDPDESARMRRLQEALERVDRKLVEEGEIDHTLAGMGTTLTALSIVGDEGFIVHVGDSRVYLLRGGNLEQLTRDHTLAQDLVDRGVLEPEEARTHRLRHVLTNVLGGKPGVEGEMLELHLADGDRLLLCTDGLNEPVRDEQIREILSRYPNPEQACRALVEAALDGGAPDNITVVVVTCHLPGNSREENPGAGLES